MVTTLILYRPATRKTTPNCFAVCERLKSMSLIVSPFRQDFRNSQARNAAGGFEAFHQPLPAEECPVTETSWASSASVWARPDRHQGHGGQRGQAQTVKHMQPHARDAADALSNTADWLIRMVAVGWFFWWIIVNNMTLRPLETHQCWYSVYCFNALHFGFIIL